MGSIRILNLERLPGCYGIKMAEDLNNNEALRKYWNDAIEASDYQEKIGKLPLGPILQEITEPFVYLAFKGIMSEVNNELERKRDRDTPCKECDLRAGCILTALILISDESRWT